MPTDVRLLRRVWLLHHPRKMLQSDAIKLSKLDFKDPNKWDEKDVFRLFDLIDRSLESNKPAAIKEAAENIVQNVSTDDVNKILTVDLNSKFTGSKTTKAVKGAIEPDNFS